MADWTPQTNQSNSWNEDGDNEPRRVTLLRGSILGLTLVFTYAVTQVVISRESQWEEDSDESTMWNSN